MTSLEDRAVNLTRELVRIKSEAPPGGELPVAEFIADHLSRHGIESQVVTVAENRANVMAVLKGTRPNETNKTNKKLLYQGHIDVVPAIASDWSVPPYEGVMRDGKLYGRGSADMKSGIAAMIEAAIWLKEKGPGLAGDLALAFVADEEVSNLGAKKMLADGYAADFCVISEPSSLDIVRGNRGTMAFEITFAGKAVHAAVWHTGINAITKAVNFIAKAGEYYEESLAKLEHPLLGRSTLNVSVIKGGTKVNIIPDCCKIEIDRRLLPHETREASLKAIEDIIAGLSRQDPDFKAEVRVITYCPPSEISTDAEIVRHLRGAAAEVLGKAPEEKAFKATCEAGIYQNHGIPSVVFGPGSIDQAHIVDEFVDIEEIGKAARIFVKLAERACG